MQLDLLRAFFVVAETGSLSRAAERLRFSQSTLTRQMRALEQEIGGRLLERSPAGVALTGLGHALCESLPPLVEKLDAALAEARRLARGQSDVLRIGYLMSAAPMYLTPALAALRRSHPTVKVKLLDLSPGEQWAGLAKGELDLALTANLGVSLARDFYLRPLARLPVLAAMAEHHPLAAAATVRLKELRTDLWVGARDEDLPGYNRWVAQLCRRAGFRPRFVGDADSLAQGFAMVVAEGAISLVPEYTQKIPAPGVVFRPLAEPRAQWDLVLAWQRGRMSEPLKALLAALPSKRAKG